MRSLALLIGWLAVPAAALGLAFYLRRRNLHSVRVGVLIAALVAGGLALSGGLADGVSIGASLVGGFVFGLGGALLAALLLAFAKLRGNQIPW